MAAFALLRAVPDSFSRALVRGPDRPEIDVGRARIQHAAYSRLLGRGGFRVRTLPADEAHPDCVFVEDTAVVLGEVAVLARPGAPSRRGEVEAARRELARRLPVIPIEPPGTLDGGDVLRVGETLLVGLSTRTDRAGFDQLAEVAAGEGLAAVPVEVGDVLHLRSAVAALDDRTLLVAPGRVDEEPLGSYDVLHVPPGEEAAANTLRLPDGSLLVPDGHPGTVALVEETGFRATAVEISEFEKADGGLTCLSLRSE